MTIEKGKILVWAFKLGLGALLLYAGIMKLLDPAGFAEEISNYRFLPELAPFLAVMLPPVEVLLGCVLVVAGTKNPWLSAAALGTTLLMAVFTVAVTQAVLRGIDTSCGCFGSDSGPITWLTVIRVIGLGVISAWLVRYTIGTQRQLS
jgi:putative oxidoreductase